VNSRPVLEPCGSLHVLPGPAPGFFFWPVAASGGMGHPFCRFRVLAALTSCACPGVITMLIGRPSALVRALIFVEKPPRERPSPLRSAPPLPRPHNDARARMTVAWIICSVASHMPAARNQALGTFGDVRALQLLRRKRFALEKMPKNFPLFELIAKKSDRRLLVTAETRSKFTAKGKIKKSDDNLYLKKGHLKSVLKIADFFGAEIK
jgi:hypothetical protein